MRKILLALALALVPQAALADFAVGTGNFPYSAPASLTTNCVVAASSSTALTCTSAPTIDGTNINAGTIPSSALETVAVAQGGTNLISLTGSKCIRSASTTAFAEASADCGTVTSVGLSAPGVLYSVSGSPVTGSGTLALSLLTQTANTVLAGPTSGGAATPTMRALVAADINGLSPTFANLAATQACIGTACATGMGANDVSASSSTTAGCAFLGSDGASKICRTSSTAITVTSGGGNFFLASGGAFTTSNSVYSGTQMAAPKLNQTAADRYATRHALSGGTYTYTFPSAYTSTPVCLAIGEGSLVNTLDAVPSTTNCVVTSSSGIDTQTVDILVVGNPN